MKLVPTAEESIVRASLPPQWVGGPMTDIGHRGLEQTVHPDDFDNMVLTGPWEGRASQFRSNGSEGLDLTRGSWHVATLGHRPGDRSTQHARVPNPPTLQDSDNIERAHRTGVDASLGDRASRD